MTKAKPKFRRTNSTQYSKLGKGRKKKQVWRRPTGRHNKLRNQMGGHPATVSIGYKSDKISRETIEQKVPVYVYNIKDISKLRENEIAVLGKIGMKKKIEIAKKAKEMDLKLHNLNVKKTLKKAEKNTNSKKIKTENKITEKKK